MENEVVAMQWPTSLDLTAQFDEFTFSKREEWCVSLQHAGLEQRVTFSSMRDRPREGAIGQVRVPIQCFVHLVACIAVHNLCGRRVLSLDDEVARWIPELGKAEFGTRVHVRHLMSHTSGYLMFTEREIDMKCRSWPDVFEYLEGARQMFMPGTVFDTQRMNTVVLGELVSRASGESFIDYAKETLREVAQVDLYSATSSLQLPEPNGAVGTSPVWSVMRPDAEISLDGLMAISDFIRQPASGELGLSLSEIRAVDIPAELHSLPLERTPTAYGLGVAEFSRGFSGADGSSRESCFSLRVCRERSVSFAVILNSSNIATRSRIVEAIYGSLGIARPPAGPQLDANCHSIDLARYAGRFVGSGRTLSVALISLDTLEIDVQSNSGTRSAIRATRKDGNFELDPEFVSICLFADPSDGKPAIMLGKNAYSRVPE